LHVENNKAAAPVMQRQCDDVRYWFSTGAIQPTYNEHRDANSLTILCDTAGDRSHVKNVSTHGRYCRSLGWSK